MDALPTLEKINESKPLIHHITNWVTIYDCANVTRAFGALPVMAHAKEEVEEMVGIASALVLNIGTLTPELIDSMVLAGKAANKKGIPVIMDAVGAGATTLRTDSCKKLLSEVRIDILKGNAGEIAVLAGVEAEVRGVESMGVEGEPAEIASRLARDMKNTVVITAPVDIVSNGEKTYKIRNGHELMGRIVGTGCMAASVIGSFAAVEMDYALASAIALGLYGLAGEKAAEKTSNGGSFKVAFFDEIERLAQSEFQNINIE